MKLIAKHLQKITSHKLKGMTLIELLLVLALVGILLSMAVPKLMPLIGRTKSLEAQEQLKHLLTLEQNYFYINSKYSNNLSDIDFEQPKLITEGGKANYKIEITEANNKSFVAKAISVTDFDQDGQLNAWQVNQDEELKETIKD